jgi:hypothetical protein
VGAPGGSYALCLGAPAGVRHAGSASENGCYVKLTRTKERVTAAGGPLVLAIPALLAAKKSTTAFGLSTSAASSSDALMSPIA